MIITDDEAQDLKAWIIKKLEDMSVTLLRSMARIFSLLPFLCPMLTPNPRYRSDADSDVLADYVLALIRAETSEPELKNNAIENLEDFLHDSTCIGHR